jgi:hypothetical protein
VSSDAECEVLTGLTGRNLSCATYATRSFKITGFDEYDGNIATKTWITVSGKITFSNTVDATGAAVDINTWARDAATPTNQIEDGTTANVLKTQDAKEESVINAPKWYWIRQDACVEQPAGSV